MEKFMNKEQVGGKFDQLKAEFKKTWAKLTDNDIMLYQGNRGRWRCGWLRVMRVAFEWIGRVFLHFHPESPFAPCRHTAWKWCHPRMQHLLSGRSCEFCNFWCSQPRFDRKQDDCFVSCGVAALSNRLYHLPKHWARQNLGLFTSHKHTSLNKCEKTSTCAQLALC